MQASDQVFLSSDGRSWTARITVEGCSSEKEALAAVERATRAALGNAADDEADAGRRRKKRPKQDVGPLPDDAANLLREYCRRENKDVSFGESGSGPFVATVTVNGSKHTGEARASKKAARESAADAFFQALVSVDQNSQHVVVQRWRERCSTDVVDMIGRLGSSTDVPWRRPGASEKDRFVAIRDHLKRQRERCETDVASQAIVVAGAVSSYPVADLSAAECRLVLARQTTAKFADVLDSVHGIVVRRNANGLCMCVAVDSRGDDVLEKFSLNQLKWREDDRAMDV